MSVDSLSFNTGSVASMFGEQFYSTYCSSIRVNDSVYSDLVAVNGKTTPCLPQNTLTLATMPMGSYTMPEGTVLSVRTDSGTLIFTLEVVNGRLRMFRGNSSYAIENDIPASGVEFSSYHLTGGNNGSGYFEGSLTASGGSTITSSYLTGYMVLDTTTSFVDNSAEIEYDGQSHTVGLSVSGDSYEWTVVYTSPSGSTSTTTGTSYSISCTEAGTYEITLVVGASGYSNTTFTSTFVILQKQLLVSGVTVSKTYNRSNSAGTVSWSSVTGIYNDEVSLRGVAQPYGGSSVGSYPVGVDYYVDDVVSGKSSNYLAPTHATVTGYIDAIQLTEASAPVPSSKEYDGTNSVTLAGGTLSGILAADSSNVTVGVSGYFNGTAVGNNKRVYYSYSLSGLAAGNYAVPSSVSIIRANITKKELSVTGTTIANKFYDGTTNATVTNNGSLNGIILKNNNTPEDVSIASVTAAFDTANAGTNKTVTLTYTLTGNNVGNYVTPFTGTTTANILHQVSYGVGTTSFNGDLTTTQIYSGSSFAFRVWVDGTRITSTANYTFKWYLNGSSSFTTSNYRAITNAGSYTLRCELTETATGDVYSLDVLNITINKKQLTATGVAVANKEYDGTTSAVVTEATINGIYSSNVTVTPTATFADKHKGTGKNVTVTYAFTAGTTTNQGNYFLPTTETKTASILARPVTIGTPTITPN